MSAVIAGMKCVCMSKSLNRDRFWDNATKYALSGGDAPFVEEVAYVMVTLHRTGA